MRTITMTYKRKLTCAIFLVYLLCGYTYAFSQEKQTVRLSQLSVENDQLLKTLDSLIVSQMKCEYFDSSLIWTITTYEKKNGYFMLIITMVSSLDVLRTGNYEKPYGYFYIGSNLFEVEGDFNKGLFNFKDETKLFSYKKRKIPRPEDYHMWLYSHEDGYITLKKDYSSNCK